MNTAVNNLFQNIMDNNTVSQQAFAADNIVAPIQNVKIT